MSPQSFIDAWYLGLTVAGVIVAVVAALLVTLIVVARRIAHNAARIGVLADEIAANTRPIWSLEATAATATELAEASESIARHTDVLSAALAGARETSASSSADAPRGEERGHGG